MKLMLIPILTSLAASADILRLSAVTNKEGQGITRFTQSHEEGEEILLIEDKAIVTEKDVIAATPVAEQPNRILVTLSAAGEAKMILATKDMRPGIDRIAIIVDGKVMSSPVMLGAPLGKTFQISGLDENGEARKLADRLIGKIER